MAQKETMQREIRCENEGEAQPSTCVGEQGRDAVQGQVAVGDRPAKAGTPCSEAAPLKEDEPPAVADATLQAGVSNTPLSSLAKTSVCIDYLKVRFDGVFYAEKPSFNDWLPLIAAYRVDPKQFVADKGMSGYARSYRFGESMIVMAGGEFTKNIDACGGPGTGEFVSKAIQIHCRK